MLKCEKMCGKCCEIDGTDKQIIMTLEEAICLGEVLGRTPDIKAGKAFSSLGLGTIKRGSCPAHIDGACSAYNARPEVCRLYYCDGESPSVKSPQSLEDCIQLAMRMIPREDVGDIRDWFPSTRSG